MKSRNLMVLRLVALVAISLTFLVPPYSARADECSILITEGWQACAAQNTPTGNGLGTRVAGGGREGSRVGPLRGCRTTRAGTDPRYQKGTGTGARTEAGPLRRSTQSKPQMDHRGQGQVSAVAALDEAVADRLRKQEPANRADQLV